MGYTYPLVFSDFVDQLNFLSMTIEMPESQVQAVMGSGEIIVADKGTRLWRGNCILIGDKHRDARKAQVMIDLLRGSGRHFYMYDKASPGPLKDMKGTALAGYSPTIVGLGGGYQAIRVGGLPVGYGLTQGDMLSFQYTVAGTTRYALHQVAQTVAANGAGNTEYFDINPPYRAGAITGADVQLVKPYCKAMLVPGTVKTGTKTGVFTNGMEFSWIQVLR